MALESAFRGRRGRIVRSGQRRSPRGTVPGLGNGRCGIPYGIGRKAGAGSGPSGRYASPSGKHVIRVTGESASRSALSPRKVIAPTRSVPSLNIGGRRGFSRVRRNGGLAIDGSRVRRTLRRGPVGIPRIVRSARSGSVGNGRSYHTVRTREHDSDRKRSVRGGYSERMYGFLRCRIAMG